MTENQEKKPISLFQKRTALESALYAFYQSDPFYANFLHEISIKYREDLPFAGAMCYDRATNEFQMMLNPQIFCEFDLKTRVALLFHETLHFMNQHLFRFSFENVSEQVRTLQNIAMDMSINQYIPNAPDNWVHVKDFKQVVNGKETPFPEKKPAEIYLELLEKPENQEANKKKLEGFMPTDSHDWDSLSEEEKQRMLSEARKLLQRTVEKTNTGHSNVPDSIKDLLQHLDSEIKKLDYKGILRRVIKKTLSVSDRTHTWNRPSKRYGVYSKGTEIGKLPNCYMLADSSGSISHREMNEFLAVISGFLKVGGKKCMFGLWHTSLYHKQKYKLHQEIAQSVIESGGTDVRAPMLEIQKSNPNLAIILTDGYYEKVDVPVKSEILWVISKGGQVNHPMAHIGNTISLEHLL